MTTDATYHATDIDGEDLMGILPGYGVDSVLKASYEDNKIDMIADPNSDGEVTYEVQIWGQRGTDMMGAIRSLIPGVENLNKIWGTVEEDSDEWRKIQEKYLDVNV